MYVLTQLSPCHHVCFAIMCRWMAWNLSDCLPAYMLAARELLLAESCPILSWRPKRGQYETCLYRIIFPLQIIRNLRNKIIKTQKTKQKNYSHTNTEKKCMSFTYHSPLIHRVTNLFKNTDLNKAFRTCNTIHNQLYNTTKQHKFQWNIKIIMQNM